jgi:hypothetical protein
MIKSALFGMGLAAVVATAAAARPYPNYYPGNSYYSYPGYSYPTNTFLLLACPILLLAT